MYPTHPGFLGGGALIKYDTILQELSPKVLKGRRQPCGAVPTPLPTSASSLVAQCCHLVDRNCALPRKKSKIPRAWGGKSLWRRGCGVWGPFWLLLGLVLGWGQQQHDATFSREQTQTTSLLGLRQGGAKTSEAASAPGAGNPCWPGEHPQFTARRACLQNRAPPELTCQQPIQGSSAAQRPEAVTRSLFWSRRQ